MGGSGGEVGGPPVLEGAGACARAAGPPAIRGLFFSRVEYAPVYGYGSIVFALSLSLTCSKHIYALSIENVMTFICLPFK